MSYSGMVTRIKVRPHPNAGNLSVGQCGAYQLVVGKDTPDLAMGVFFPTDGQLGEEFCKQHDLVARKDTAGNKAGGYFSDNRRVRCQKFRGEKSEGFWMPLSCLAFTGVDLGTIKDGDPITVIGGIEICRKYYTPATLRAIGNRAVKIKKDNPCFARHLETEQFKREAHRIPDGARLIITEKVHGTSHRVGFVFDRREVALPWYKRLANWFSPIFPSSIEEYVWLNGTRNVVIEKKPDSAEGYYGSDPFRIKLTDPLRGLLHKGEILYGEMVGYTDSGAGIMGSMPVTDKEMQKVYGKTMQFSYGNEPGKCSFLVYRITMGNNDGVAVDLSWEQVEKRCEQLGLKTVPFLVTVDYGPEKKAIKEYLDSFIEGPSTLDPKHIREGICIRWEAYPRCGILKHKSFTFLGVEDAQKADDAFVDKEEIS